MTRRHPIIQVFVCTSLLLATPTARAEETWCSDYDDALPAECFPDVLCPQYSNYLDYRRAVVHISGPDVGGTGVLINNAACTYPDKGDLDCGAPYVLTAAHLVTSFWDPLVSKGDIVALETETTFTLGYEAAYCGGNAAYSWEFALSGAQVLWYDEKKDLMLIQLSTAFPAEAGPYFVGWGYDGSNEVVAITHPCGDAKKIAVADTDAVDDESFSFRSVWVVESWDEGGVISGSSGGPLLTENGKLIGIFTNNLVKGDVCPGGIQQSVFTDILTIVPFLGNISSNFPHYGAYDSNDYLPIHDVETNNEKYGPGEVVKISAKQEVVLGNGFHAEAGSDVHVIIVPAGP